MRQDLQTGGMTGLIGNVQQSISYQNVVNSQFPGPVFEQNIEVNQVLASRGTLPSAVRQVSGSAGGWLFPSSVTRKIPIKPGT